MDEKTNPELPSSKESEKTRLAWIDLQIEIMKWNLQSPVIPPSHIFLYQYPAGQHQFILVGPFLAAG